MENMNNNMPAEETTLSLPEIRVNIDRVDAQMRELFIERMKLADQVAQVKAKTEDKIYKPEREAIIIEKQSENMDERLLKEYRALIKRIMEVSRKYQYGRTLELRSCFPYSFETQAPVIGKAVMVRDELFICDFCSKDQVRTVRSFDEMQKLLESGEADTGIGIIEKIGSGVSDELNSMLLRNDMYINSCKVVEIDGEKYKVVTFTNKLVVLPEHNRLKLVFTTGNRSGALGSILSMISDYGVNLTEIHSIPFRTGDDWNYQFFVEISLNLLAKESQALVFQLSQESATMQLLGSYLCEGDFVQ